MTQNVSAPDCDRRHKWTSRLLSVVLLLMTVLIILVTLAIASGNSASGTANQVKSDLSVHEAKQNGSLDNINIQLTTLNDTMGAAVTTQDNLSIHEAKQNGSLDNINTRLSTLCNYHSTLRGETKELRTELKEVRDMVFRGLPDRSASVE